MLAHFSLLGAFFSLLAASWALCRYFQAILCVFWASWNVPGLIFEGFGKVLEAPGIHFSRFFRTSALGLRKRFDPYKTMAGAVKIKACALTLSKKIYRKSHPRAFRTKVPAKNAPKICLGACQGRFWSGLGVSWAHFGRLLATLGRLLAISWPPLGHLWGPLGCFLASRGALGPSWDPPRGTPGHPRGLPNRSPGLVD